MIVGSFFSVALLAAALDIEIREPVSSRKAAEITEWIEVTAEAMTLVYGRFPNPDVRIIVIPSTENAWGGDSPVIFGRVTRRNGETVELFVNTDRPIDEFYADWTATHEFSHLMLPQLSKRGRWISEGFASYYQNIIMARAGRYTPELAWQKLSAGYLRGQQSRPELSPNEAASAGVRNARMKLYWSGAALALLADVELRAESGGSESLDTVLGRFATCCLPAERRWSGPELFKKLDSLSPSPVFMPLYDKYARAPGFPDVETVLSQLGVRTGADGIVSFDDDAAMAEIRVAISSP